MALYTMCIIEETWDNSTVVQEPDFTFNLADAKSEVCAQADYFIKTQIQYGYKPASRVLPPNGKNSVYEIEVSYHPEDEPEMTISYIFSARLYKGPKP